MPDIRTFDGVLDLLSACILTILGNVLDFRTYSAVNQDDEDKEASAAQKHLMATYDLNNIPRNERIALCYARGVALGIFHWVRTHLVITGPDGDIVPDLPSLFLVQILKALMNYKGKAMQMKLKGAPHCDTMSLRKQVMNVLKCDRSFKDTWNRSERISDHHLVFEGKGRWSVQMGPAPHIPAGRSSSRSSVI